LSFRSLNDRLARLEQRQLPRSGASIWACLAGAADPADLDETGRELLEAIAKSVPDEVPDEVEAEIQRLLALSGPDASRNGHLPTGLKELPGPRSGVLGPRCPSD
jgi:hypothetical protein